jgi:DNA-binding transcriptional LysR family regulator
VLRQRFDQLATEQRCAPGSVLEVNDVDTRKQAILSGLGVGLLTQLEAASSLGAGELAMLHVDGFPIQLEWVLAHPRGTLRAEVHVFKEFLRERCGGESDVVEHLT